MRGRYQLSRLPPLRPVKSNIRLERRTPNVQRRMMNLKTEDGTAFALQASAWQMTEPFDFAQDYENSSGGNSEENQRTEVGDRFMEDEIRTLNFQHPTRSNTPLVNPVGNADQWLFANPLDCPNIFVKQVDTCKKLFPIGPRQTALGRSRFLNVSKIDQT